MLYDTIEKVETLLAGDISVAFEVILINQLKFLQKKEGI